MKELNSFHYLMLSHFSQPCILELDQLVTNSKSYKVSESDSESLRRFVFVSTYQYFVSLLLSWSNWIAGNLLIFPVKKCDLLTITIVGNEYFSFRLSR